MFGLFRKKPAQTPEPSGDPAADRSAVFEGIAREQGFTLLAGRFGGELGNDQLAIRIQGKSTQLLLGLKVTDASGGVQLDPASLGHMQFSREWLLAVIRALRLDLGQSQHADHLEAALGQGTLNLFLLVLTRGEGKVGFLRVALQE